MREHRVGGTTLAQSSGFDAGLDAVGKSTMVMAQSFRAPESLEEANRWFVILRDGMPNRHPIGTINDLLKPFLGGIPKDCSDQAIYMAEGFKTYGYQSGLVTADSWHGSHAYFYVVINGTRYYGDTWDSSRSGLGLTTEHHPGYPDNISEHAI